MICEVIKYGNASFLCNKVDILVICEVIKYENASFLCNKVDILVICVGADGGEGWLPREGKRARRKAQAMPHSGTTSQGAWTKFCAA